jgi:fatty acid desaturase
MRLLRRQTDRWLLAYQAAVYALFAGLVVAFPRVGLPGQMGIYFVALMLTQKYESPLHYSTHTPLFNAPWLNRLHRISWCVLSLPAVLYRREHFHHHRHNNRPTDRTSTLTSSGTAHCSVISYALRATWTPFGFFGELTTAEKRECAAHWLLCALLHAAVFAYDARTCILFWVPVVWILAPLANALFCYLGHVPGTPYDKGRSATYFPVHTRWHRFLSWVDFHNAAFHLTHHLKPSLHWSQLGSAQSAREREYEERGSPRSLAFNSMILCNPIALLMAIWRANAARADIAVLPHARRITESAPVIRCATSESE